MRGIRKCLALATFFICIFFAANFAYADTEVSGSITEDTTWTEANSPYILTEDVTVAQGVTLTIEPGVVIKGIRSGTSTGINIEGKLNAIGTESEKIVFTSIKDADYGGSGVSIGADEDYWGKLIVAQTGEFNGDYIVVRYGNGYGYSFNDGEINVEGKLNIQNSVIEKAACNGIRVNKLTTDTGDLTLVNNTIINNPSDGVFINGYGIGKVNIQGNEIKNNGRYPMEIPLDGLGSSVFEGIKDNTFEGNSSGDGIGIRGSNNQIDVTLAKTEAPYILDSDIGVVSGKEMTIEPGVVIKGRRTDISTSINIEGKLNAIGTESEKIVFTSIKDADYGGTGVSKGVDEDYWGKIIVTSTGEFNGSYIDVRYGNGYGYPYNDGEINVQGKLNIQNSVIEQAACNGIVFSTDYEPQLMYDSFIENNYGIYNNQPDQITVDASYCYWGSPDGPTAYNPDTNQWEGDGDKVSSGVIYKPFIGSTVYFRPEILTQESFGQEGDNVATGNFCRNYTDLTVASPGFGISIGRTYNSKDTRTSLSIGKCWTFSYEGSIKDDTQDPNTAIIRLPDGSIQTFAKRIDGTYTANDSHNTLVKQDDGTYILTTTNQDNYGFSTDGWLTWIKDRNQNAVTLHVYSDTGKVYSITDADGRQYTVAYNAQGFISSVTDPSGRTAQYEYDNNLLARAIDPMGKITRYSYDSNGILSEVRDNDNNLIESIDTYTDGDNQGKVHQTTDAYGNTKTYAYDTSSRETTITDSNGRQTITWYDQFYYPTKTRDAEGKDTTTEYSLYGGINKYGDEKAVADRNGNLTQYERDSNGNITKVTNPDQSVKLMTYDDKNNLLSEKDEDGKYTFYVYDADKKNLIKKVQPLNGTDAYSEGADQSLFAITNYTYYTEAERQQLGYNARGLLKTETDPEGKTTTYAYNANGNPTSVTDPENNTTTYGYNEIGLKTSEISPKGYNTQYVYDLNGNIEKTTLNNGETARITYDAMGRKTKEISPNLYDSSLDDLADYTYSGDQGTRYTYYTNGLIHTVTDSEGNTTSYTYDIYGNKLTETKPNGAVYVYEYDVMNRLSKAYFKEDANSQAELTDEYAYETLADGKTQITHTQYLNDSETAVTANTYDYAQRQVAQQNPDSTTKTIVYNPNGTIASSNDENNSTTYYKYDGLNRLTEQWTPFEDNNGTLYTYTSTTYDKAGKKISTSVGKDKVSLYEVPVNQITQTNEYYNNGLLKATYNNAGSRTDYEYDQDGNVSKESVCTAVYEGVASKNIIEFVNNHFGKPTEKKVHVKAGELSGNDFNDTQDTILTTAYTYDADGNVKTQTTPDNVTTTYTYDRMDRKTLEGLPVEDENGNTVTAEVYSGYDWDGKIAFKTDANGNTTTYAYDKKGNLKTVTDAEDGIAAYYYDKAGRKIAEVSANNYDAAKTLEEMNRTEYAYDPMNRVITVTNKYKDQDGGWRTIVSKAYKYDNKGNVVKELTALGYSAGSGDCAQQKIDTGYGTEYSYNLANKVVTVLDSVSKDRGLAFTTKNEYDAAGRITTETNAAGVVKTSNYDDSDNLTSVTIKKTANDPEKTIQLNTYDLAGNKLTATDGNGNTTAYEYNAFNKLRKAVYPGDSSIASNTVTYQYDDMENLKK